VADVGHMRTVMLSLSLALVLESVAHSQQAMPEPAAEPTPDATSPIAPTDDAAETAPEATLEPASDAPAAAAEASGADEALTAAIERADRTSEQAAVSAPAAAPLNTNHVRPRPVAAASVPASAPAPEVAPTATCLAAEVPFKRIGRKEEVALALTTCDGRPNLDALAPLAELARPLEPKADTTVAVASESPAIKLDAGLLTRLQGIANAYPGRAIEIVSGYRPHARPGSRHRAGRAIDLRIEGVDNRGLSELARTFDATGVGYYPNSTFVHVDVRDSSFYWVDRSKPGQRADYAKDAAAATSDPDESAAATEVAAAEPAPPSEHVLETELLSLSSRALAVMNAALGVEVGFDRNLPTHREL